MAKQEVWRSHRRITHPRQIWTRAGWFEAPRNVVATGGLEYTYPPPTKATRDLYSHAPNGLLWQAIQYDKDKIEQSKKLSAVDRRNLEYLAQGIIHGIYDFGSRGLAIKLGVFMKLMDPKTTPDEMKDYIPGMGWSNFYASAYIRDVAKKEEKPDIIPEWYFRRFTDDKRFLEMYKATDWINQKAERIDTFKDAQALQGKMTPLAWLDLYTFYELANMTLGWINEQAPGVVQSRYRPIRHRHERNNAWRRDELTSPLNAAFSWPHTREPNLSEIMQASYRTLVGNVGLMGPNFQEEISIPVV